ncbi:ATP-binding protein [Streptomyces sp. NPDC057696]|uniref:ATP-binding protein n=1 Tax=unclassified Streptomyces TaxID=2593676 RepID=UPI003695E129
MSLPLTRRIARAALLIAAGAAPVVGAAGSASAVDLPATPNVGGLTALDGANVGNTVDGAAKNVSGLAGDTGSKAVKKAVPAAGKAVGRSARTATHGGLPTDKLGSGLPTGALPATGELPTQGLPLG